MDYKHIFTENTVLEMGTGLIVPLHIINKFLFGKKDNFCIISKIALLNGEIIIEKNNKFYLKLSKFEDYINLIKNMNEKIPFFPYNYYNLFDKNNTHYYSLFEIINEYIDFLDNKDDHFSRTIKYIIKPKNMLNCNLVSSFLDSYCLEFENKGKSLFINIGMDILDKDNFISFSPDRNMNQYKKLYESHKQSLLMEDPETFLINNLERVTGDINYASLVVKSYLAKDDKTTDISWISNLVEWKNEVSKNNSINSFISHYPHLIEDNKTNFEGFNKFLLSIEANHLHSWEVKEQINELYYKITHELISSFEMLYRFK
jgi:hypothetical protein